MNLEILKVLYENKCLTSREISQKISITYRVMKKKIKELEAIDLINYKYVFAYTNGYRELKVYFLTEKGEKLIKEII